MMDFPMDQYSAEQLIERYERMGEAERSNFHQQVLMGTAQFIGMLADHGYDLYVPQSLQENFYELAEYHENLQSKLEQINAS